MHPILPPPGNGIAYDRIHGARRESKIRHADPVICRPCHRDAAYQHCRKKKDFFHNGFWFGYDILRRAQVNSGEGQAPQEVGAIARAPRTGTLDRFDELQELGATRERELLWTHRHALQLGRWIAVNDARFNRHVEHVPEASNRVVVARRGSDLAKPARPFRAIGFRDPAHFALRQVPASS